MSVVGLPTPHGLWIGYVLSEFIMPAILITSQVITNKKMKS
ncbi:MAG TPA: hypothetical protein VNB90_05850 [Cytophagaceae bacterium]|nr:hypothetical protein [Cytophagaceae bacterium]